VWQVAFKLATDCFFVTKAFPKEELFGLTSQLRRAGWSVPCNIAEGQGRQHRKEFLNHLSIARGSLMELETLIMLSASVEILSVDKERELLETADQVSRMLTGLRRALKNKP